jgi:alanine-glyoxylate transaminase / (R)-3-amino-2-methylpropionate-pyruvate transaminase
VHHALNPDQYRGSFGSDGEKYAKDVQEIIDFGTTGRIAGFISEPIQVCSYLIFPGSYITSNC